MKICPKCKSGVHAKSPACPECSENLDSVPSRGTGDLVGMIVDSKYEFVERIGEGGMGLVYRAIHTKLGRPVAAKVLKTFASQVDEKQISSFKREATAISRLNHPHIISMIDFGRTPGGLFFLITEYVEGKTLFELLKEIPLLSLSRIYSIFIQILSAVEEAHSRQIIHRDLKPDNILVTPLLSGEDFVKVFDFGVAALSDERPKPINKKASFVGTPGYMAPETILSEPTTFKSDIYALGCVLFQMLTGREIFEVEGSMAILASHISCRRCRLHQAR
jgi:serine/threonine protein kinase